MRQKKKKCLKYIRKMLKKCFILFEKRLTDNVKKRFLENGIKKINNLLKISRKYNAKNILSC